MKRIFLIMISLILLSACSQGDASANKNASAILEQSEKAFLEQKSFKGKMETISIVSFDDKEPIAVKDEKDFYIIREGSLSKELHRSSVSGQDAEKNLPENEVLTYTEEDPNKKENIIVYGYFSDQWSKESRPKDISVMDKISKDPIYFQDYIRAQIMKNKDSFDLLEEDEDYITLKAVLSPDQIEDEMKSIENEELRKYSEENIKGIEYFVVIEKNTKLPKEIRMEFNQDNQEYSEIYTYTEFNSEEEIAIPEEAKK